MNSLKSNLPGIITCVFEMIVGGLLLVNPVGFTAGIIVGAGIILMIMGITSIIKYFSTEPLEAAKNQLMSKGLIILLIGGFCVFNSNWFIITFPVITLIYGVMILLTGVSKIQWMMDAVRLKKGKWFLIGISALTSIVCGLVIITSPFSSTTVLWMFTGFSLIVEAVFDIISLFLVNKENYRNSAADTMMNEEIAEE